MGDARNCRRAVASWIGSSVFRSLISLSTLAALLAVGGGSNAAFAQDEDEAPTGLFATYFAPGGAELFTRSEAAPAMRLAPGTSPDPRLPETGWKVRWNGVLRVLRPAQYRFWIESNGPASLTLDGKPVKAAGAAEGAAGEPVELKFGAHAIVVEFTAEKPGATIRLYWQGENFAKEPLSALSLEHTAGVKKIVDPFGVGQLAIEEHSCVACHSPGDSKLAKSLVQRPGPRLSGAGTRLKAGWIYQWLGDPHAIRPEAVMPQVFGEDRVSEVERYAIAAYLAGLGSIPEAAPHADAALQAAAIERGKTHFSQIGCVVCHEPQHEQPAVASLRWLGDKTTTPALEKFVKDPSSFDPAGRMPNFALTDAQIRDLSAFLITYNSPGAPEAKPDFELPSAPQARELRDLALGKNASVEAASEFTSKPIEEQLAAVAVKAINERRCINCHELKVAQNEKLFAAVPAKADFAAIAKKPAGGCLAPAAPPASPAPRFGGSLLRGAAVAFLKSAVSAPATPSPAHTAALHFERLNCTNCHARNGADGLSTELVEKLLEIQTAAAAEAVKPPVLTGVAGKLTGVALQGVLEEGKRSRPWMSLQMPTFRKEHLKDIPAGVAALDGDSLLPAATKPSLDKQLAEAGRTLVGTQGFGCIKCHDMLGTPSGGTRGPDLSLVGDRIRGDWYHRWMIDPQRIEPGTRMPTVFLNNASPYANVLGGAPDKQIDAIWHYLLASKDLPPPEGLAPTAPTVVETLAGSEIPQLVRSFLPNLSPRGVAIRFPNRVHLAFDVQSCRLGYAWSGDFLDMGPVWNDRGGRVAGLKGEVFWTSPAGFPWEVNDSPGSVPDFSGRGASTEFGATLPHKVPEQGRNYPVKVHFKGYGTSGAPTFHYAYDLPDGAGARFDESVSSLDSLAAKGVLREAKIAAPAGRTVWFFAGESEQPIQWKLGDQSGKLTANSPSPPAGAVLTLVQQGKPLVLHVRQSTPAAEWATAEQGGKLCVFVRLPSTTGESKLSLAVLRPNESDAAATIEAESVEK